MGLVYKDKKSLYDFVPRYTEEDKKHLKQKTIEQQIADDIAFATKLKSMTGT